MKKGPEDTLRWFRRGIFRAFYFFFVRGEMWMAVEGRGSFVE